MPRSNFVKEETVETEKAPVKQKKKFDKEDGIPCRSITVGSLFLDGIKSKTPYVWSTYGDITEVEYQDLAAMVRSRNNGYIYGPLFVIEDDDFIDEFPALKKFYDDQYTVKELEGILNLSVNDMVATIRTLPKGAFESLKSIASTKVVNGELDSIRKVRALDEVFGTELGLLSDILS